MKTPKTAPTIGRLRLGAGPRVVLCATDARPGRPPAGCKPDLVEARIDLFGQQTPEHVVSVLRALARWRRPLIATVRTASEGGAWRGSERDRERLFRAALPLVHAVDVELRARTLTKTIVSIARDRGRRVIISSHDLERTPPARTLHHRIRAAFNNGADIVKLATYARNTNDVATLLGVLLSHRRVPLVVLAMGPAGMLSRVFFTAAGSLLTYAFADGDLPAAPGQLPISALQADLARYYPGCHRQRWATRR